MATLAFLMNYISDLYEIDISDKFKVFINDYSSCRLTSDIYTYKFFIVDNDQLTLEERLHVEDLYIASRQFKNTIRKFLHTKKILKYENPVDTDLYFNKLNLFPSHQTITIICNKALYSFRLSDMINMWLKALKNTDNLFVKPLLLKNPYTNLAFEKYNLYNIFIAIQFSPYHTPNLIHSFIKNYCSIHTFTVDSYPTLKDNAIHTFVDTAHSYDLMENINNMMHEFKREVDYIFFPDNLSYIRKKRVIKNLKPILRNYLYGSYGCNPLKKREAYDTAKVSIKDFFDINPYEIFTLRNTPPPPRHMPPPPIEGSFSSAIRERRRRVRRLFEYTANSPSSISFSIPPTNSDILPVTIEEIVNNIANRSPMSETNEPTTRRQTVRPYSLQLSAFTPSRDLPRTPPNNNANNSQENNSQENNTQQPAVRPYGLQLFR
jgi:hypothetical protein